jgi:hypothetical protein
LAIFGFVFFINLIFGTLILSLTLANAYELLDEPETALELLELYFEDINYEIKPKPRNGPLAKTKKNLCRLAM